MEWVVNNDVVVSWDPVTTTIYNTPITPSGYAVFCNADPAKASESWTVIGYTLSSSFTHTGAATTYNSHFIE
jgi:hypothetical protein